MGRPSVAVVHLVRRKNGVGTFDRFLQAYRMRPGGRAHDLVLLFKGFGFAGPGPEYLDLLAGVPYEAISLADYGYDLRGYFAALRRVPHDVFCFLNSFSRLKDPEWLEKLYDAWDREKAGIAGATGSWVSHLEFFRADTSFGRFIPFGGGRVPLPGAIGNSFRSFLRDRYEKLYRPFPNPHIRTNAFLAARKLLEKVHTGMLLRKGDVHRLESARNGLTGQVEAMGKSVLVVGRDGKAYPKEDWPESRTFFSGEQENLLVGDNRTEEYDRASPEEKIRLSRIAWGERGGVS